MMGLSCRRTSTTTNEQVRSTGPREILGLGRFTTRARMERRSNPELEYTGRPRDDGAANENAFEEGGYWVVLG